ncbi:Coiled-coil domain-containing protein 15 [Bagarius yarrelli]|uniref:Coiled-coil domain-containing protein 15 n=1 Tax=Bagarius yarrelli TaxID=175774 RepID=A0A556UY39_BAGYA|nr:Coiled-coil domain-containing protein 15 [Bagarius yarrelli]
MSQPRSKSKINQKRVKKEKISSTGSLRKQREMRVLAERNPAVVPVGAWVETGEEEQEHPAIRALLTEELLEETRRVKEENLRQFQDAVRRRVSEQARLRKRQQLQTSYKTMERECLISPKRGDSAGHHMAQKSQFTPWPQGQLTIGSPSARWVTAQEIKAASDDTKQHQHQFSRIMTQVRHRLAACQTARESEDFSELPGGIWKASPVGDQKIVRSGTEGVGEEEDENEEVNEGLAEEEEASLDGQHDQCVRLQNSKTVTFQNTTVREKVPGKPHPTAQDYRATQVLWSDEDQEEQKKQRRCQFLKYRRLVMDTEREQVKEHQRHKKHLSRIARIKAEKEQQREDEERSMEDAWRQKESQRELAEKEHLVLERLRLEEEEERRRTRAQKLKETTRYVEALRAHIKEKLEQEKVELPPLCCCGESFWDSHPDTCANNCVFYNNPKAYAQALHAVLLSCELYQGSAGPGGFARKIMRTLTHHNANII